MSLITLLLVLLYLHRLFPHSELPLYWLVLAIAAVADAAAIAYLVAGY
jgi:hypothetical protein